MDTIEAPETLITSVGELALPERADQRMQELMDRHTDGALTGVEEEELAALVEWSEEISLLRAQALLLLGKKPK
jgi:hypothetical protein